MFIIIKNNALCNCSFPNIIHAKNGENFLHCKADLYNKASLNKLEFSSFYTCNTIGKNLFPNKNENIRITYKFYFKSVIFKSLLLNETFFSCKNKK